MSHTLQLALLSPEIIHLAIIGALPEHISLTTLKVGLQADWEEQNMFLQINNPPLAVGEIQPPMMEYMDV